MTSAGYILAFRERYHLSRYLLANYLGCAPSLIARIEEGMEPSGEWWEKFREVEAAYNAEKSRQEFGTDACTELEPLLEMRLGRASDAEDGDEGQTKRGEHIGRIL
ncbi:MAG: hypothetical protein IJ229_01495 [Clostridia bacterium]|nr:hypothetical protein [Clostridia bacterium]